MAHKTSHGYNGWSGKTRSVRGKHFYAQLDKGLIPRPDTCEFCGISRKVAPLMYHAEEYGPLWEDYVEHCHGVCCHCHGMLHIRFRYPWSWEMYKNIVRVDGPQNPFFNMGAFFQFVRERDCAPINLKRDFIKEEGTSGVEWVDKLHRYPYKGEPKMPLKLVEIPGTFLLKYEIDESCV